MQLRMTVVDPACPDGGVDVLVHAPPSSRLASVRSRLLAEVGAPVGSCLSVGARQLDDDAVLGLAPLLDGALLRVGPVPALRSRHPRALLELHVTTGPDCGQIIPLPPGPVLVGRGARTGLRLSDPDVSREHAELTVGPDQVLVRDLGSTNGTWVDGQPVGRNASTLGPSSVLTVGSSTLRLARPGTGRYGRAGPAPAAIAPGTDGTLRLNRSPRIRPSVEHVELRVPRLPDQRAPVRLPMVAMLLPLLLAGPMAWLLGSAYFLVFAVLSPVMMLGSNLSDRRAGGRDHRAALARYERDRAEHERRLQEALDEERQRRCADAPDNAELLSAATGPLGTLWARRPDDDDALTLRIGTRTLPSSVRLVDAAGPEPTTPEPHPELDDLPVTVSLPEVGVLGVAGPPAVTGALARSLLAQVTGWHSPLDVTVVVLSSSEAGGPAGRRWAWTRWLPHCRPDGRLWPEESCSALVGLATGDPTQDQQLRRRVSQLGQVLDARSRSTSPIPGQRWSGRRVVVLLDGAHDLRALPGVARLLRAGPAAGMLAICTDSTPSRLPVECAATVSAAPETGGLVTLQVSGRPALEGIRVDGVGQPWASRFARALAPLRDATPASAGAGVPDAVRLLDLLDVDATSSGALAGEWRTAPRATTAVLGSTSAGPYTVDLRRDGPHLLVAGTTGAGKSELLQTLIASLSVANRPDQLSFVLVDYKGGAAFADCARLPHTVGLVTDLDAHLTERALTSLRVELRRRERLLAEAGAQDLDEYLARSDSRNENVPRLVLVIDEFRVLAEELPEFVAGLVRIAAVGRSLGIHLVLATQRPAGVVSADIKANMNLRIALRLRDATDSEDVIEAPDAARVSERTPGRAVARAGANPLVHFQTARVAGGAPAQVVAAPSVLRLPWGAAGDPVPPPPVPPPPVPLVVPGPRTAGGKSEGAGSGTSDLARVVEATRQAAQAIGCRPVPSPWLPQLPDELDLDELDAREAARDAAASSSGDAAPGAVTVPWALADLPDTQQQRVQGWDVGSGGHLVVVGTSRSGRSTLLRTLAASAARRMPPSDLHLYALDGSGGAMQVLTRLPHTGAVAGRDDVARGERVVARLVQEMTRRQEMQAATGASGFAELRAHTAAASGEVPPCVVLLVDGWEAVLQSYADYDSGRVLDLLHDLVRAGAAVGIQVVLSGDRTLLMSRIASSVPDKVLLRMADPTDLVLAGVASKDVPRRMPPGRALAVGDSFGTPREVQVALLARPATGEVQTEAMDAVAAQIRAARSEAGRRAGPVPIHRLPRAVSVDGPLSRAATAAAAADAQGTADRWVLVGVGGDDLRPVGLTLGRSRPTALVAGPAGSGRSTCLVTMTRWLLGRRLPVALVVARPSPLEALAGLPGVLGCFGPASADGLLTALDQAPSPPVVLVDDAELLADTGVENALLEVVRAAPRSGTTLVAAGSNTQMAAQFRGLSVAARATQQGILLDPTGIADGDLLGVRVPRTSGSGTQPPGRGLLVRNRQQTPIQVASYAAPVSARAPAVPAGTVLEPQP